LAYLFLRVRTSDGDRYHFTASGQEIDYRLFGIGREIVDSVDAAFDICQQFPGIVCGVHFDADGGGTLAGTAGDLVNPFQILDCLFDQDCDALLHVFGCRAAKGYADVHLLWFQGRKHFQGNALGEGG